MKPTLKHLLLGTFIVLANIALADEMDLLQARLRQYISIGDTTYDTSLPEINNFLTSQAASAQYYAEHMRHDTTFLWDDISLLQGNKSYTPAHINSNYDRLLLMARAWVYPGSPLYHSDKICQDIRYGLDFLYKNAYNERTKKIGNWWEWRIGIPWKYASIVSILYEEISDKELLQFEKSTGAWVRNFVKSGDLTYANQASLCRNLLAIGILTKNPADIRLAIQGAVPAFSSNISPSERMTAIHRQNNAIRRQKAPASLLSLAGKEGLWEDGTFIQHTAMPYIGTYGTEVIACAGYMARLLHGTSYAVPEEITHSLNVWINKAFLPSIYRGESMLMFMGRGNAYDPYSGARMAALGIMDAALLIPDSTDRYNALRAAATSLINDPHHVSPYEELYPLPLYKQQIDEAKRLASNDGDRFMSLILPAADRAIHQTPDWRFGLAMSSNRIGKYECFMRATDNQNTTGWYSGDGMTYLYIPSDPQQYYQYFLHVNPYRLPGTTVDLIERQEVPSEQPLFGTPAEAVAEARAGGVMFNDSNSAAMMCLVGGASPLRAHKSWFMLGNQIICLGSNITLNEQREVITTIDNRRFSPALSVMDTTGHWQIVNLHAECEIPNVRAAILKGIAAYCFPTPITLHANHSPEGNTEIWVSHGLAPQSANYAYTILPGAGIAQAQDYINKSNTTKIINTQNVQAVRLDSTLVAASIWDANAYIDIDSVAIYEPQSKKIRLLSLRIESKKPASLIIGTEREQLTMAISDPTWEQSEQTITLRGQYRLAEPNDRVSISYDRGRYFTIIRIKQKNRLGQTTRIRLSGPYFIVR